MSVLHPLSARPPAPVADERAYLRDLMIATSETALLDALAGHASCQAGCDMATCLKDSGSELCASLAADAEEVRWARSAKAGQGIVLSENGGLGAWRLADTDNILLLHFHTVAAGQSLCASLQWFLDLASDRYRQILELTDLRDSHQQLEQSENLQRALFTIVDLAGSDLDMSRLLRGIHMIVSGLMYAENFFIVRHYPERGSMEFLYFADVEDHETPEDAGEKSLQAYLHTLTWHLITGGRALIGSPDELAAQIDGPISKVGPDSSCWLGVPMLRDGLVHGALVVQSYHVDHAFSEEDRQLLEFVGSHILTALERRQSKQELEHRVQLRTQELAEANRVLEQKIVERQRAERLQEGLFQLAQLATADIDEGMFYQRVHHVVGGLINAENFYIGLLDAQTDTMAFPYVVDQTTRADDAPYLSRHHGRGLSEYVLAHGALLIDREGMLDLAREGKIDLNQVGRLASCWLGVRLQAGDQAIGLVVVQSYTDEVSYGAADQELLSFAALQIANSMYRRRSAVSLHEANIQLERRVEERTRELKQQMLQREIVQQELKHQVMHDPLTGLPNRGMLRDRLDRVLGLIRHDPARRCALLYLDVDRFKIINDSLGHLAGDAFLKAIATRLLHCVREPDIVARLSGDEFAILLENVDVPHAASHVATRVLETLCAPLLIEGRELEPSVSVGVAFGDAGYHAADELLRDADIALYRAKALGRKRFELFDETLAKNVVDVLTMEGELRQALQQNQFEPYFQPIRRLSDGQVLGYEALIRWHHPSRGLLQPADFVQIAQDIGQIEAIDWRLFELACQRLALLPDQQAFLTFNVSALHLRHNDFDRSLLQLIGRTAMAPDRLVAEVTEESLLDDPERVRATLERLRQAGVAAALDDFGTGYSSLSYLHSLPLRILKVDKAFVQELDKPGNVNSTTVVAAILALAKALDIQVIAEGIETPAQHDALVAMGCDMGQGYLLGRPAPIERWMAEAHGVSQSSAAAQVLAKKPSADATR